MSDQQHSGFGQFIPGFDFLQNLAKGGAQAMPQMPGLSNWIAPTLDVEELDKRIAEMKAVRFWLEQNATAVGATIQALEVQKMTLATLQGMNVKMADLAESMKLKPGAPTAAAPAAKAATQAKGGSGADAQAQAAKVVDPLQWWGALTQQFQQIAATAMQEVAATPESNTRAAGPASAPARAGGKAAAKKTKPKRPARKTADG